MSNEEIQTWKKTIDSFTHYDCAHLYRFSPSGHPIFDSNYPLFDYFMEHFKKLGGMTPEISKAIGW